jgi:hypothetical protein
MPYEVRSPLPSVSDKVRGKINKTSSPVFRGISTKIGTDLRRDD